MSVTGHPARSARLSGVSPESREKRAEKRGLSCVSPLLAESVLLAVAAVAAPSLTDRANAEVTALATGASTAVAAQNTRENFRARINENVVTIMAGSPSGTDLAVVQDIAEVLDDGDNLRVLPMVGKGPEQNIKDVMFLRGVDMGITQAKSAQTFRPHRRSRSELQRPASPISPSCSTRRCTCSCAPR